MFSNLKKKIQQDGTTLPEFSESLSSNKSFAPGNAKRESCDQSINRAISIESLDSTNLEEQNQRGSRTKRLETKIQDLAAMIREKNAKIEELERTISSLSDEHDLKIKKMKEYSANEIRSIMKEHRNVIAKQLNESSFTTQEQASVKKRLNDTEKLLTDYKEQVQKKSDEYEDSSSFFNQELSSLKHILLKTESEMQLLRGENEKITKQRDESNRALEVNKAEMEFQNQTLENLKAEKKKAMEDIKDLQTKTVQLSSEKEEIERKLEETTDNLSRSKILLNNLERSSVDLHDRNQQLNKELEQIKSRLGKQAEHAQEREEDLKDRIRTLELRLVEVNEMSNDERVNTMNKERTKLEEKLSLTKQHLSEVKNNWNDKITALESQIANLNLKITEDAEEMQQILDREAEMKLSFEKQLDAAKRENNSSKERVISLENANFQLEETLSQERIQNKALLANLRGNSDALQTQLDTQIFEKSEAKKLLHEANSTINQLESKLKESANRENKSQKTISQLKSQVESHTDQITQLEKERFTRDLKITTLESEINQKESELADLDKKLSHSKAELKSIQNDCKTLKEEKRALEKNVSELENKLQIAEKDHKKEINTLHDRINNLVEELDSLKSQETQYLDKISQLETEKEAAVANAESSQIKILEDQLSNLQIHLADKDKTIKIQKQRMGDLKKTLERELKVQCLPNEASKQSIPFMPGSMTGSSSSLNSTGFPGATAGFQEAVSNGARVGSTTSLPSFTGSDSTAVRQNSASPLHQTNSQPNENFYSDSRPSTQENKFAMTNKKQYPPQKKKGKGNTVVVVDKNGDVVLDPINFKYLKHVIVKFLLSKETEAIQLVCALSTLLHLSSDEETMVRQSLEYRRSSWFPSLSSSGSSSNHRVS